MIRIRCETGVRPRNEISDAVLSLPDWTTLAIRCANLQARSILETGRKKVSAPSLRAIEPDLELRDWYKAGLIELVAWDEHDRTRELSKIRSVDLSLRAAENLIATGRLPRCFLPILMSEDLIDSVLAAARYDDLTVEEFKAWIECGGLSDELYDPSSSRLEERRDGLGEIDLRSIRPDDENSGLVADRCFPRPGKYVVDRGLVVGREKPRVEYATI